MIASPMMSPPVMSPPVMSPPVEDDQARANQLHQIHNLARQNENAYLQRHAAPSHRPSMPHMLAPTNEAQPLPKRQRVNREGPPRLPLFLREMQADHMKMAAERAAAAAAAANPGSSTVDLTNGMRSLHDPR